MAAFIQNPNSGALFTNHKKANNAKAPDYVGSFTDSTGKKWRLAAWTKPSQKGGNFFSIKASEVTMEQSVGEDLPF